MVTAKPTLFKPVCGSLDADPSTKRTLSQFSKGVSNRRLDVVYTPVPTLIDNNGVPVHPPSVGRSVAGFKVVHLFTVTFGMSSKIVWYLSYRAVDKCDVLCSCKIMETASTICVKRPFNLVTWPQPFPCCQGSQGLFKMCIIWNKRSTICTHSQEW